MRRPVLVGTLVLAGVWSPPHLHLTAQAPRAVATYQDVLSIEDARAPAEGDVAALLEAARSGDEKVQAAALRALGRLERRDLIPRLLPFLEASNPIARDEAANAVAQSFRGEAQPAMASSQLIGTALGALLAMPPSDAVYRSIGRLPFEGVEHFRSAEAALRTGVEAGSAGAARGLESMARLHRRLAPLDESTFESLRRLAARRARTHGPDIRRNAMAALVAAQGADAATIEAVLKDEDPQVRRLGALALAGAGSLVPAAERIELLRASLADRSHLVRLEAIRGWLAHGRDAGCAPLVAALDDESLYVTLAAMDGLGERCMDEQAITDRLAYEARTPPGQGRWQREAHAFVALAKRAPDRGAVALPTFAMHPVWQVRMYAVRAAAAMDDVATLQRLAADADDNVAAAALPPLRRRLGAESDSLFIAALSRRPRTAGRQQVRPYDLVRTAAIELKGAASTPALVEALAGALQRISAERCETSRDMRLALLERLGELGSAAQESALTPLLRDPDPGVAGAAASLIERWSGRQPRVETPARPRDIPDRVGETPPFVRVTMESGRSFWLAFHADQAPVTTARFLALVRDRYYDGLTFHRVVPNFVIQGGSPGANEYCGNCPFWRDEVGLLPHVRGTVGVSTRGRDTGDAQIFVNLVDSPRLDHQYTVFAYVCHGMDEVDAIQEGDRMKSVVASTSRPPQCR